MISLIFILLAFTIKVFMDLSSEDNLPWGKWWNKNQSWENKYKFKPRWLFTTVLVWITDFWHLAQMFFLNFMILAVVFYKPLINIYIDFIIYSVSGRIVFELMYKTLKNKL